MFIYFFSNKEVTLTGIYEIDINDTRIARELDSKFRPSFNEAVDSKMIMWDEENEKIFIVNRFKLIPNNKSLKVLTGVVNELALIRHPFKQEFIRIYGNFFREYGVFLNRDDMPLLTEAQVKSFVYDCKWNKQRIKEFYMNEKYPEQKIDEIIGRILPNLR